MFGFSMRHGPHHEAQKSINLILPWMSESRTSFPAVSGSTKSGATCPICNEVRSAIRLSNNFAGSISLDSFGSPSYTCCM